MRLEYTNIYMIVFPAAVFAVGLTLYLFGYKAGSFTHVLFWNPFWCCYVFWIGVAAWTSGVTLANDPSI